MLGFQAKARNGSELRVDSDELEEARWFHTMRLPLFARSACGCRSVARLRALIEAWLAGDEAGYG